MDRFNFAILGGDNRCRILYEMLCSDGYKVKSYQNKYINSTVENLDTLLTETDILILPIPISRNGKDIFIDDNTSKITIDDIIEKCCTNNITLVFGGVINNEIKQKGKEKGISFVDFFDLEAVAVLNAVPTAEGAICSAIEESDITIFSSKTLVLGYGRCGKILANMLKGMGADVTVSYRSEKDKAYIKSFGYKSVHLNNIKNSVETFDFIFNTIPSTILNSEILNLVNKNCTIIDIAQAPGGVDYNYARSENIKAIYCPGLPGRVAPVTASKILKTAIFDVIEKL